MTGYHHAKKAQLAKQVIEDNARRIRGEEQARLNGERLLYWKAWLQEYRARPRPSNFNWAPRYPFKLTPPKEPPNAEVTEEIIEGEYAVVADHVAASDRAGEPVGAREGSEPSQPQSPRRRPTRTGEFETPF